MSAFKGFVARITTKTGTGKRGPWTLYSFKLEQDNGQEYEDWISFGFDKPPFSEGDYIECEADIDSKGYFKYVKGTGKQIKNPPARASAKPAVQAGSVASETGGTSTAKGADGADRQTQIVLQHSQEIAVRVVVALLSNDALPMSEAKTKAGSVKRYDEITASIDKLTVKYFNDVTSGRLLSLVADTVPHVLPDGPIPPVATKEPKRKDAASAAQSEPEAETDDEGVF